MDMSIRILRPEEQRYTYTQSTQIAAQGITPAQAAAMNAGSLFGGDTKAADPANYDEEGRLKRIGKDRGGAR